MTSLNINSKNLKIIKNDKGDILHGLKSSDSNYRGFGEAYFSKINYKKIKAWKKHTSMTCNLIVPYGSVHFVCIHKSSVLYSETIGFDNYKKLTIPPGIWFGFMGLYDPFSLILNISDIEHDSNEMKNKEKNEFTFNWEEIS